MDKQRLSENIRKARKSAKMTQVQLCFCAGISSNVILSQWENGQRTPKLENIEKIATCIGCSPIDLLDGVFEVNGDDNA